MKGKTTEGKRREESPDNTKNLLPKKLPKKKNKEKREKKKDHKTKKKVNETSARRDLTKKPK